MAHQRPPQGQGQQQGRRRRPVRRQDGRRSQRWRPGLQQLLLASQQHQALRAQAVLGSSRERFCPLSRQHQEGWKRRQQQMRKQRSWKRGREGSGRLRMGPAHQAPLSVQSLGYSQ